MNYKQILSILAQIIGLGGTYMLVTLYQQSSRKNLLSRKRMADILLGLHYVLLFAWAGAIPNLVGIARETIFIQQEKGKKWSFSLLWPALFIVISWILAIISWKGTYSVLPMCASTVVTISLWVKSPKLTRILSLPVCICFIIYDVFVKSYAGMLNESLSIISIFISLFRHDIKRTGEK